MTERGRAAVTREPGLLAVGPSAMRWTGEALVIDLDEIAVPIPRRVRGRIRLVPDMIAPATFALDPAARHAWRPIAPRARIEVEMEKPALSWRGGAYWDSNEGSEPLEAGFADWQWSRAHLAGRETAVLYEGIRRDGSRFAAALRFDGAGRAQEETLPLGAPLPRTLWAMPRRTRADDGFARVVGTWEDAPFYARSALATRLFGEPVMAVHESLSMPRFVSPVVQWMLPYRMPRRLR
jgi:carotenoid 1,2-hydratase